MPDCSAIRSMAQLTCLLFPLTVHPRVYSDGQLSQNLWDLVFWFLPSRGRLGKWPVLVTWSQEMTPKGLARARVSDWR